MKISEKQKKRKLRWRVFQESENLAPELGGGWEIVKFRRGFKEEKVWKKR